MKVTIISDNENKLLGRNEANLEISFEGKTPSGTEVQAEAAKVLKADVKLVVVKGISQVYGGNKVKVLIYVYTSEKDLKKSEKETRKSKKENKKKWIEEKKKAKESKPVEESPKVEDGKEESKQEGKEDSKEQKAE